MRMRIFIFIYFYLMTIISLKNMRNLWKIISTWFLISINTYIIGKLKISDLLDSQFFTWLNFKISSFSYYSETIKPKQMKIRQAMNNSSFQSLMMKKKYHTSRLILCLNQADQYHKPQLNSSLFRILLTINFIIWFYEIVSDLVTFWKDFIWVYKFSID